MFLEVEHHLSFDYSAFIRESFLELRMQPKTTPDQTLSSFVLAVGPPSSIARYRDWNDNAVHHFTVTNYHNRIAVEGRSAVSTHPTAPPIGALADRLPLTGRLGGLHDFTELGGPVRPSAAMHEFHRSVAVPPGAGLGALALALGAAVSTRFEYQKNVTRYDSTTDDFLRLGAGVCQDFAHLMLAVLRLRRIPCRYVSGYLQVEPKPGEPAQSHAWVEVHSEAYGWVPFDPTHNRPIDEGYVVVAHGRHYDDVPPNRGIYRGSARETLSAEVKTTIASRKPISVLHEEIRHIDLPVFRELPLRAVEWVPSAAEEAAAQQQQ